MKALIFILLTLFATACETSPTGAIETTQQMNTQLNNDSQLIPPDDCPEPGTPSYWTLISQYWTDESGTLHIRPAGSGATNFYVVIWKVTQPIHFIAGDPDKDGWLHIPKAGFVAHDGIYLWSTPPPAE